MALSLLQAERDSSLCGSLESADLALQLLRSISIGKSLAVVMHSARSTRARFLDGLIPALSLDTYRVIRTKGQTGGAFDLRSLMDQVVPVRQDGVDRVEQFCAVLTRPKAGETGIVLIIDDAQLLTDRALKFLDLVLSTARLARSPLHLLLVGTPLLWERLPAAGNLAAGKVDTCIRLANAAAPAGPIPNRPVPDRPVAEAAVRPPVSEAGLLGAPGFGAPGLGATGFTDETGHRARAAGDRRGPRLGLLARAALVGVVFVGSGLAANRLYDPPSAPSGQTNIAAEPHPAEQPSTAVPVPSAAPTVAAAPDPPPAQTAATPDAAPLPVEGPAPVEAPAPTAPVSAPTDVAASSAPPTVAGAADPPPAQAAATPVAAPSPVEALAPVEAPAPKAPVSAPSDVAAPSAAPTVAVAADPPPAQAAATPGAAPAPAEAPAPTAPVPAPSDATLSASGASASPVAVPEPALPTPPQHAPPEQVAAPAVGAAVPQPLAPGVVATLVARGNALLATGDIAAARLMYARAAGSDSGEAAAAMGMTYDPRFLAQIGAKGIAPDPRQALVWYRRASDLGSADGARLLTQLQTASGN